MKHICVEAWHPGKNLVGDEHTISFKGQHANKLRINYKKAGGRSLPDAVKQEEVTAKKEQAQVRGT
eukprot:5311394-Ditylum_brightwellii.AAC.1